MSDSSNPLLQASGGSDLPTLSIRRPVLVLVLNLLIVIAGLAALGAVEIRELPNVDRPIVSVRATYPGASPETMDAEVTRVLEGAVARVSGLRSIESSSEENSSRMRAEFDPGVDLDTAAADVREAVSRVIRMLPERVEDVFVVKADDDAQAILSVSVVSDSLSIEALSRIIESDVVPELISVTGVADVQPFGTRQRTLRIVVDPLRLTSFGLSMTEVAAALRQAPFDVPAGSFRSGDQELIVRADASVRTAEQVGDIFIADGVRIRDFARVFFGPADPGVFTTLDGLSVIGLGIIRQAGSNTIQIADAARQRISELNERFQNIDMFIIEDSSVFIRKSIQEVILSLALTVTIVIATIWLFMGSARATLVPGVTIPVALIGTLAAVWLLGFSINNLTLLALVLATGLVVDDAIVVLENVQRRRGQGLGPRAAAVVGTRQVYFAVLATSAVLIAVFVPIAFLPGTAGGLFREFGFVLAVAVAISSFVALSLVPAMTSRLPAEGKSAGMTAGIRRVGGSLNNLYGRCLEATLTHPLLTFFGALALAASAAGLYSALPKELLPTEDRGVIRIRATGPDGVGLSYMERQTEIVEQVLRPYVVSGEVQTMYTVVGAWDPNRTRVTLPLAPWGDRQRSQQDIMKEIRPQLASIPGAGVSVYGDNSLEVRDAGDGMEVAITGSDYQRIFEGAQLLAAAIEDRSEVLTDPRIQFEPTQPQLSVDIDRQQAADLGIDLDNLAATLRAVIDGDDLIDLNIDDEAVPILLEAGAGAVNDPSDLVNLYVRAGNGDLVPLSSVVRLSEEGVATELDRHGQRRAIEMDVELPTGYPLADAAKEIRALAAEVLPPDLSMVLLGRAATLDETSRGVAFTYAVALLVVFLVLCAQFEGFVSAIVVTLTVPFGVAAAIAALHVTGTSLNIYSQIGLVLLIGLMAKNSILMVEFADQLRDRGYRLIDAVRTSAQVRLRPITMTMLSTVLGGLPLILSSGAGAEARQSIGWVIFGGLGFAAIFTLFLTPVIYLGLGRFARTRSEESQRLAQEMDEADQALTR
ncbi:MAG: efflux RND transporter permease subunit [Pseudomonadota bacterium]